MNYGLSLVTPPLYEPVSLPEAKLHLKIDDDQADDDALVIGLIQAARERAEVFTGRVLVTQTWDVFFDRFPSSDRVALGLPHPPLQSVTSISYIDTNGQTQVWGSANYIVDATRIRARILPAYGGSWPTTRDVIKAVTVRLVNGYGTDAHVPEGIKQAMRLTLAHWYRTRESVIHGPGLTALEMPDSAKALLWSFRVLEAA